MNKGLLNFIPVLARQSHGANLLNMVLSHAQNCGCTGWHIDESTDVLYLYWPGRRKDESLPSTVTGIDQNAPFTLKGMKRLYDVDHTVRNEHLSQMLSAIDRLNSQLDALVMDWLQSGDMNRVIQNLQSSGTITLDSPPDAIIQYNRRFLAEISRRRDALIQLTANATTEAAAAA